LNGATHITENIEKISDCFVCVSYFMSRVSTVFMAGLDASKAFDRVNHVKLFNVMQVFL